MVVFCPFHRREQELIEFSQSSFIEPRRPEEQKLQEELVSIQQLIFSAFILLLSAVKLCVLFAFMFQKTPRKLCFLLFSAVKEKQ